MHTADFVWRLWPTFLEPAGTLHILKRQANTTKCFCPDFKIPAKVFVINDLRRSES